MNRTAEKMFRHMKFVALGTVAGASIYGSVCTAADVRHNVVAGTQSFIKGYTSDFWFAVVPAAEDVVNTNDE